MLPHEFLRLVSYGSVEYMCKNRQKMSIKVFNNWLLSSAIQDNDISKIKTKHMIKHYK